MAILAVTLAAPAQKVDQAPRQQHTIKTIYVIPSSHWDLGFIVPPEEILPRLKPHIDEVIANCKADREFRWTIESVWQVEAWLERTDDPKLLADFVELVKKGQIQVSAVWGSTHTEFMGAEQLNRIVYDMKEVQRRLGISSDFAMMDDVPGFTIRLPQVLAGSGIKYFLNGSNTPFGGGTALYPGKMPFYWKSQDGSRVLMWQTQGQNGGYTEAMADYYIDPVAGDPYHVQENMHFYPKEWKGLPPLEIMQRGVDKLLAQYEKAGYPYDAVLVMYLHDFIPSDWERDQLLPNVRRWNAAGKQPRIIVATPAEFFHYMESKYGDKLPTYAGDWSGLWSEVKTNSPAMSARARWAQDHTSAAETIWSLASFETGVNFPRGNFEIARTDLLKYDEHSGAGQYGWPKTMSRADIEQQNREYAQYTTGAQSGVQELISSGLRTLLAQKQDTSLQRPLVVFNPLSWERSEVVRAKVEENGAVQVRDLASGKVVPSQRIAVDEIEFFAEAVPPVGYRTYSLEAANGAEPSPVGVPGLELGNEYFQLKVRPSDGAIISIFDKQLQRELVKPDAPDKLNELLRWIGMRMAPRPMGRATIQREHGVLGDQLVIHRANSYWPETRITLPFGRKAVVIDNTLDRSRMPYVASAQEGETYGFAFPFNFNGSSDLWIENGAGFHRLPTDYLPGARTDGAVPQHAIAMAGTEDSVPYHIVVSQREAFYDVVIAFPGAKGQPGAFLNEIRAVAMRKTDQGDTRDLGIVNFPTPEPGMGDRYHYSFAITSAAGDFDPVAAYRAGMEFAVPMLASALPAAMRPAGLTGWYFSLSAPNVVIVAFRPSVDGNPDHYLLRLQEIAGKRSEFKMSTRLKLAGLEETSLTEDQVTGSGLSLSHMTIGAHQTLTLRLTIPHDKNQWQAE